MDSLRDRVAAVIGSVQDVVESESMFGNGAARWVNGKEIAHFDADDCIEVTVATEDTVSFVAELVALAATAHRPPLGSMIKPPPTGADLERRRRFH